MNLTIDEVIEVNKKHGGDLLNDSSLHFAENSCKVYKSKWRCISIWVRAINVDHAFLDANKRTSLYVIGKHVKIKDQKKMGRAIIRIARRKERSLDKIREVLQNANR